MSTTLRILSSLLFAVVLGCGGPHDLDPADGEALVESSERGVYTQAGKCDVTGGSSYGYGVDCVPRMLPLHPDGAGPDSCVLQCYFASAPGQVCRWSWLPPTLTCCSCDCQDVYACYSKP